MPVWCRLLHALSARACRLVGSFCNDTFPFVLCTIKSNDLFMLLWQTVLTSFFRRSISFLRAPCLEDQTSSGSLYISPRRESAATKAPAKWRGSGRQGDTTAYIFANVIHGSISKKQTILKMAPRSTMQLKMKTWRPRRHSCCRRAQISTQLILMAPPRSSWFV